MHVGLVSRGDTAYTLDLANLLYKSGLSITLYLPYEHVVQEVGSTDQPVEQLYRRGLLPSECKVRLIKPPRMRNPLSLITYSKLSKTIVNDGVDIVHILAGPDEIWISILSTLIQGIPVVGTMIVPKSNVGGSIPSSFNKLINKLLTVGSDLVIVNGSDQVEFVHEFYKVPLDKIIFIPLNSRTTAVKWSSSERSEEPNTILFFGAARFHKGLEYLVRAQPLISEKIPTARILISAHGDELSRCRGLISDNSKFEIHEGFASGQEMAAFFQRASLVVLPYLSASTSGVLMTAYSFGKPVVATNVGCLPEYVEHNRTGFVVEPANINQLADAIIRLLLDNSTRLRMGETALEWLETKNLEIAEKTISVYKKAIVNYSK